MPAPGHSVVRGTLRSLRGVLLIPSGYAPPLNVRSSVAVNLVSLGPKIVLIVRSSCPLMPATLSTIADSQPSTKHPHNTRTNCWVVELAGGCGGGSRRVGRHTMAEHATRATSKGAPGCCLSRSRWLKASPGRTRRWRVWMLRALLLGVRNPRREEVQSRQWLFSNPMWKAIVGDVSASLCG